MNKIESVLVFDKGIWRLPSDLTSIRGSEEISEDMQWHRKQLMETSLLRKNKKTNKNGSIKIVSKYLSPCYRRKFYKEACAQTDN